MTGKSFHFTDNFNKETCNNFLGYTDNSSWHIKLSS